MSLGATRVIWTINDLSVYVDQIVKGYIFMCIDAQRGQLHSPQIISTQEEYQRVFGFKTPRSTDPLVVEMGLRNGGRFILSRLAHYESIDDPTTLTALTSNCTISDRGNIPMAARVTSKTGPFAFRPALSGRMIAGETGPFTFGTGSSDQFKIQVGSGSPQTITLTGSQQTAAQVVTQLSALTGVTVSVLNGCPYIVASALGDSLQLLTVANDAYSVLGFVEGTYAADPGTTKLIVSANSGTSQTVILTPMYGETGIFSLTAAQVADQLHVLTDCGASIVNGCVRIMTIAAGENTSMQIEAGSTAAPILNLDNLLHYGASGISQPTLKFSSQNPGDWGNYLTIQISDSYLSADDRFNVKVVYGLQGELQEYYSDVSMDPTDPQYVVNYIEQRSILVTVEDLGSPNPNPMSRPLVYVSGVPLVGGDDGGPLVESDYIGNATYQSGMYACDQNWNLAMDLMIPGTQSVIVYQAMIAYCENRQDMMCYGQVPFGMLPEEAVDWRLGNLPWTFPAFDSQRFALYFGFPLVYDDMDDTEKYIPCLGHLAACLGKTDNNYGQWYAPAGPKRGMTDLVLGIDFNVQSFMSTGYADLFANNEINYLFISQMQGIQGAMFWEQNTTLTISSACRELNVMRFLTMLYRCLMPVLRTFLDDLNHPVTWREVYRTLQPAFESWKSLYGIYDYALQTDRDAYFDGGVLKNAVLNSGYDMDQGIYHCRCLIQPTRVIRYLEFTLGVMKTGEAFTDYLDMTTLPGWVRA